MTYLAPSLNWNLNRSIVLSILKLNVNRASDMSYLLTLIEFILTISSWIIVKTYPIWFRNFMKSFFSLPNSKFRSWISSVWSFSSCFLKSFSTIVPSASSEIVNAKKTDFGLQFLFLFQTVNSLLTSFESKGHFYFSETILKATGVWLIDFHVEILQAIYKTTPKIKKNIDWRAEILLLNKFFLLSVFYYAKETCFFH